MDNLLLQLDAKDTASPVLKRFANNTRDAGKGINSLGKNLKDAAGEIPGLGNALNVMGKGPMVALAAGSVAVAGGFAMMIKSTIDMADNMNDMSIKLGISTERLSVLKLYADQSGTSIEDVADAMTKLGVKLASGDKDLASIGITAGNVDEAFYQVADKIAATEDPMLRLKIATDAFGKSGANMIPLLSQGSQELRKISEHAPIVSTALAKMADEFNDKMTEMQGDIQNIGIGITTGVLPYLTKWLEGVNLIRKAMGLLTQEEQKAAEKRQIIAKYGDLFEKQKKDNPSWESAPGWLKKMTGSGKIDGKTLQEALGEIDKKYTPVEPKPVKRTAPKVKEKVVEGTEVDVGYIYFDELSRDLNAKANIQKKKEDDIDNKKKEQREEQLKKEKEKNDKLVAMANTTAQALSTPFQQFGQDLFDSNKSIASSFEDLFGNIAESFSNMLIQMASEMLAKAAIFSLFNAFTGGGFSVATGGLGGFLGIPGFAKGTDYAPGGLALVGEQGPELVNLPRGSKVRTAKETAQSGITQVVNIYNQNLSEKQITDIVVKSQRKIANESNWRRTNV